MRRVGRIFKRQVEARLAGWGADEQLHINTEQNKEMNTLSIINISPELCAHNFLVNSTLANVSRSSATVVQVFTLSVRFQYNCSH